MRTLVSGGSVERARRLSLTLATATFADHPAADQLHE
jgi:hypothetical protein